MTPWVVHLSLNTVLAGLPAFAAVVSRRFGRPALTHVLWVLVLVRLLVPPIWSVQWPPPVAVVTDNAVTLAEASVDEDVAAPPADVVAVVETMAFDPWPYALGVWAAGTLACLGLAVSRCVAYERLIRCHGRPAPAAWNRLTARLARRIGLKRVPRLTVVPVPTTPHVWALIGRPILVLSENCVRRRSPGQRAAVVAHELAHLVRGDHFVRWLELLATAALWWHPLAWWARHELRRAEEDCCDAWVVWALPGGRRAYATALVETADEAAAGRWTLAPVASGLGRVRELERRIVMILRNTPVRGLGRFGAAVALGLGLTLVPVTAGRADDEDDRKPERRGGPPAERRDDDRPERPVAAERLRAAMEKAVKDLEDAHRRVEELHEKMRELGIDAPRPPRPPMPPRPGFAPRPDGPPPEGGPRGPRDGEGRGGRGRGEGPPEGRPQGPPEGRPRGPRPDGPPMGPRPNGPPRPEGRGPDGDRRNDQLQREVEELRRELAELRRELGRRRAPDAPRP